MQHTIFALLPGAFVEENGGIGPGAGDTSNIQTKYTLVDRYQASGQVIRKSQEES